MPDAIITSTASTFGTISGTFAADQSTIVGTVASSVVGNLSGSVGVPGPAGAAGPGVPAGGTAGQYLQKIDGVDYNTDWVTVNLGNYLVKSNNLSDLTNIATARDNLQLGTLNTPTFAGVTVQGAGSNIANLGATFLTLNHTGYGQFTIQPSTGITFPDASVQTTAFNASVLLPYAPLNSPAFTGDPTAPTAALGDNDTSLATTAFVQQELASGTAVAKNLEVYVRNQTGSTLAAGAIVYINGATGNRPTVTLAQANNDANSAQTMGFVKTAIANNGFGYVIVRGEVENLDTSALTEGVQLYLSPTTAGTWTTTKPSAPQHLVYVGIVIRSHPTQGVILVAVQNGYELNELHDVAISSPTNGQVLKYNSSTGLWYNGTDSSGVAWGGITGTLSSQTDLQTALDAKYDASNPSGYITSSALTGYATESWVTSQGYITSSALTPYAPLAGATFTGLVNTVASTTTTAGFRIPHGTAPTAPVNGDIWTTTTDLLVRLNGTTRTMVNVDGTQTISGSKTFSNVTLTFGNSTAASTVNIATGATISASTKTVNIGTSGVAGSTTNITIGSTTGTSTTTLQGTTNGVTAAADTNSVALATTAFVVGQAGSATPLVNGTAAVGTSLRYARQDHVHPTDTTRAALASPTFTGTPAAPTAAVDTNTTQLATTAYVVGQGYLKSATASSTYAPLASPALTGTPTAPTATAGTNTTQLATTAFVQAAVSAGSGAVWGSITGTLSSQTDLQTALNAKLDSTTAAATYQTISGMSSYLTTASAASTYAPLASPTFTGTVTIPAGASISGYATTASLASYAPLASPALTGTPTSTTAAVDTNTTQVATTAFVVGQASATTPLVNGTAAVGTSLRYARADHVHGTDTTRAPLASPTFTGTPAAPTATAGTSTTQIATTAFVTTADNLKANLASPTFTGTPAAPTAAALTNTTQIATTAFVRADNNVKAWVNFNGTGTVAIRASLNVSSITDNGTGDYTVNFTNAMADANYAVSVGRNGGLAGANGFSGVNAAGVTTTTASLVRIGTVNASNIAAVDSAEIYVAILR